jgi:5-bromo-4-chloroindolyl phosphate hydrolysis protein
VTLEGLRERLKNSENNYGLYIKSLLEKLKFLLLDDEEIIDAVKGTYSSCPAILVPTNQRVLLIFRGDQGLSYSEILNYEEIINIHLNVSLVKEEMVIMMTKQEFVLKDLANTYHHEAYCYILNRIKNLHLSVLDAPGATVEVLEPESFQRKESGFLELVFASAPITTFLSFFIMGCRAKSTKYFLTALFYLLTNLILIANGSTGLILMGWLIGLVHFGVANEEYNFLLNQAKLEENQEEPRQIEDVITIEVSKKEITSTPKSSIPKVNPYIEKMRQLNIAIEDETVSNYLNEMEVICQDIFIYVEKHPERESEVKSFINYYLPQTFSLLEKYDDLSEKTMKTANIQQAMDQITGVLAVIVEAFKNLYNKLYENEATQISIEIKVLKDILTQNGLTKESGRFEVKK